mmetsp:Transcript_22505/g.54985  ORF Transcript_22505/g.54985 Transcript_22505/m.54985 type:complete len:146 (-) Transcript_22505:424-861(-)
MRVVENDDGGYVNLVWTKKSFYRSGDIHQCSQVNSLVRGRVRLLRWNIETGEDVVSYHSAWETVVIEAHVPHLFYFETDTLMTEAWRDDATGKQCFFESWHFAPYRKYVTEALRGAPLDEIDNSTTASQVEEAEQKGNILEDDGD